MIVALCFASPVSAENSSVPKVVTDIPPTHSLVSMVMGDLGSPELLMAGALSPHDYGLRPSNAQTLSEADLVIWMHPELTPWLDRALSSLASKTASIILMKTAGVTLYPAREHLDFIHKVGDKGDSHQHNHAHSIDPHGWLDPVNALIFLEVITQTLMSMDPDNASSYQYNAQVARHKIEQTHQLLSQQLAVVKGVPFLIMHDSLQYIEKRFALSVVSAVSSTDAVAAGPRRMRQIRLLLQDSGARCVFAEVQESNTVLPTIIEGLEVRQGLLDPVGVRIPTGPELYTRLLTELASDLVQCLDR